MKKVRRGRALLVAAALLLLGTAMLHATGAAMVAAWTTGMPPMQQGVLRLVWLTDSVDWAVAAIIWLIASRRAEPAWRSAAALLAAIPILCAVGLLTVDPTFFGTYLLLGSGLLALTGVTLMRGAETAPA